jgi:hypothetical protein
VILAAGAGGAGGGGETLGGQKKRLDLEMGYDKLRIGSSLRLLNILYVWLLFLGGLP